MFPVALRDADKKNGVRTAGEEFPRAIRIWKSAHATRAFVRRLAIVLRTVVKRRLQGRAADVLDAS
jgi:hypothetical protein